MKLQHLISTMHRSEYSFLDSINLKEGALVVNQANGENNEIFIKNGLPVHVVTTSERGLSNSRNMLIDNSEGDICILGDDDIYYLDGYEKIIEQAYNDHPDADIIAFSFTQELGKDTRRQFPNERKLNIFTISKIASVEITFKAKSIKDKGVRFDPLLGLGAEFGSSEENAFLADALRAGLTIKYVPITICYLKPDPEDRIKWKDGFNEDYFVKRGACFHRIYRGLFLPMTLAFIILKKRGIFKNVPVIKAVKWMIRGRRIYKQKNI